jgi:hypothetical protein
VKEGKHGGCMLFLDENKEVKPVEIVLRMERGRIMERVIQYILKCTVNTCVNITVYPPVQLFYANKSKIT